ncbi:hypothetical protein PVK06_005614 [Gossypium arboreum]|uniref:Uncharacterized protein n=1 Tax=Gossypium arboreum TaxID=29729 RepID=A0ABR0QW16_GOSAR|nr:hypothetical protein PVK06_005614 [Gossypium arboreum]
MFHHMPDNHHQICFVRHEDHRVLAVVKIVDDVVVVQDRSVRFVGSLGILLGVAFTNMIRRLMGCMHRRSGLISQSTVSMGGHAIKSTRSSGLAIPSTVVDLAWYPDSGATAHMTNDSVNFFMLACTMEKDLLYVPDIRKNLLSVSKFAKDNGVFFEFYPNCSYVKDLKTHQTLLC